MRDWQPFLGLPLWVWLFVFPSLLALFCLWQGPRAVTLLSPIWRVLDRVYKGAGVLAAVFMVLILLLIISQMVARWSSMTFPGSTEYAGYAMAATSFFALAYRLTQGAHIRVSVLLKLNRHTEFWLDAVAMFIAAVTATYFARYAVKANFFSEMLNDRTQGQDQIPEWLVALFKLDFAGVAEGSTTLVYTPVWIPQLAMSIGTVLLAIALWDTLYRMLVTGVNPIVSEAVE